MGAVVESVEKSLLTEDVRQQIVDVWAANIWQTATQVRERLARAGVAVAHRLVEEAGRQSGLMTIRAHLKEQLIQGRYGAASARRLCDGAVVQAGGSVAGSIGPGSDLSPGGDRVDVTALRQLAGASEPEKTLEKPWPWLFQVEHWLFGEWQLVDDGWCAVRTVAASTWRVKSKTPRLKAYRDEHGQRQTLEVYRYYCKNPDCPYQTFTNLPPGLIAYSVWTLDARLKALELYTGLRTNYRSAANALGVAPSTLYHWLDQFGAEPLQVAALFGLVRSSGVVGIDEKYVQGAQEQQTRWQATQMDVRLCRRGYAHARLAPHQSLSPPGQRLGPHLLA